jgi:hypothetical protein
MALHEVHMADKVDLHKGDTFNVTFALTVSFEVKDRAALDWASIKEQLRPLAVAGLERYALPKILEIAEEHNLITSGIIVSP